MSGPGRWQPGQSGNPGGRPKRPAAERYLRALEQGVTLAEWKEIVEKAVSQAQKGDSRARTWLSEYLIGKPIQRTEISGPDGKPIETKQTHDVDPEFFANVFAILGAVNANPGTLAAGEPAEETRTE